MFTLLLLLVLLLLLLVFSADCVMSPLIGLGRDENCFCTVSSSLSVYTTDRASLSCVQIADSVTGSVDCSSYWISSAVFTSQSGSIGTEQILLLMPLQWLESLIPAMSSDCAIIAIGSTAVSQAAVFTFDSIRASCSCSWRCRTSEYDDMKYVENGTVWKGAWFCIGRYVCCCCC